ncbi:hypothetical protein [Effusibacillus dendaii]|uniref:Uncharacterized protein n=1 Tax=Effusibacillus dendaii TaxID=2743772 RepID=A0A7I8DCE2_9BACL|nr:hypothetical protein [Effusibacillus dendaii]BCJ87012.1 hypothetical protein skT53_19970 [Effusibacillus dendaii]
MDRYFFLYQLPLSAEPLEQTERFAEGLEKNLAGSDMESGVPYRAEASTIPGTGAIEAPAPGMMTASAPSMMTAPIPSMTAAPSPGMMAAPVPGMTAAPSPSMMTAPVSGTGLGQGKRASVSKPANTQTQNRSILHGVSQAAGFPFVGNLRPVWTNIVPLPGMRYGLW